MIKTPLIIGVYTCPKFANRQKAIEATWFRDIPNYIKALFVRGDPGGVPRLEGSTLYLDCPEAYEKLAEKTHKFFKYCSDNFEFQYIFKTDDSSYIDLEKFLQLDKQGGDYIGFFDKSQDPNIDRTWHYGKCSDKSYEVPYKGHFVCSWARGGGYFVSQKASRILVEKTFRVFENELYEDKMVGEALTRDERLKVVDVPFYEMGVLKPMPHNIMHYVHSVLKEKQKFSLQNQNLKEEVDHLKNLLTKGDIASR